MEIFHPHSWDVSLKEARKIQRELSKYVVLEDGFEKIEKIAGIGIVFSLAENEVTVFVVLCSYPELKLLDKIVKKEKMAFPYKSGYFAFSCGPKILSCLERIEKPDLMIFPGRGIYHPRKLGLASHLGVLLDLPTIACSKTPLWSINKDIDSKKGAYIIISQDEQKIGAVVRSKDNTKPIFITPGHKISVEKSVEIILNCCSRFRLSDPLREASILDRNFKERKKID
jgi:deoxyribonuclease V